MNPGPQRTPAPALLSIAMPVYNCAATLPAAIQSILNQTFGDWELWIVDDGSNDGSAEIARGHAGGRIRTIADGQHRGLARRLNQAIELSRGKYFARMDGDDVSYPQRLARQAGYLEAHPEVDLLGGRVLIFGQGGRALGTRECRTTHEQICKRPWAGFYLAHPTWMGRTEWFRRFRYRPEALRCEDQDLLLRSHASSRFASLAETVLGYREDKLSLQNILAGRKMFARLVIAQALGQRKYGIAAAALAEQTAKAAVDWLAIASGLGHRLLRHRAAPLSAAAAEEWATVWKKVGKDVQRESAGKGAGDAELAEARAGWASHG